MHKREFDISEIASVSPKKDSRAWRQARYRFRVPSSLFRSLNLLDRGQIETNRYTRISLGGLQRIDITRGEERPIVSALALGGFLKQLRWYFAHHRAGVWICAEVIGTAAYGGHIKMVEWMYQHNIYKERENRITQNLLTGYISAGLIEGLERPLTRSILTEEKVREVVIRCFEERFPECVSWFHRNYPNDTEKMAWFHLSATRDYGILRWITQNLELRIEHTMQAILLNDVTILKTLVGAGCPLPGPEFFLLSGAGGTDRTEEMRKYRAELYPEYNFSETSVCSAWKLYQACSPKEAQ